MGLIRKAATVPADRGPAPACVACGSDNANRGAQWAGPDALVLCVDAVECAKRYRGGASPESFAAGLRGEILVVAP